MKYYSQLPTIQYEFEDITYTIKNIFLKIGFIDLFKSQNPEFFEKYFIEDGQTPELIAYNYYGNQDLWWLILILNDIKDPFFDWCLSSTELEEWSIYQAELEADNGTYTEERREEILNQLKTDNENKREIYLLRPEYVNTLLIELIKNTENNVR